MGWYQDNFPGSPAAKQRILVSRTIVAYSVVVGAAIYAFSPFLRRIRKEVAEGREIAEHEWFRQKRVELALRNRRLGPGSTPTLGEFIAARQKDELDARGDHAGPVVPPEVIREKYSR